MKKYKVIVDSDDSMKYEYISARHALFNFLLLPILSNLPRSFQKVIKKSNKQAAEVIDNATTHQALEVLYHGGKSKPHKNYLQKLFRKVWFSLSNSKAVRNRLRIVKREIDQHIRKLKQEKKDIKILSIAAGSARAVLETIEMHENEQYSFHLTFLDKSLKAIEYSKTLSQEKLKHSEVFWVNDTIGNFFKSEMVGKYDIVEMVGLIDYFDDEKTQEVFEKIYSSLNEGGMLITANVNNNLERKFLERIIDWHMIYRKAEELAYILEKSNFEEEKMSIFYEPLKIHSVIVARK